MKDLELLGEYVQKGSEAAFAELVRRHIDWVQGAALRQVGSAGRVGRRQMAEDVTQGVFIALVQQGRKLVARGRPLAPWLLKVVRYASIATHRAEKRRKEHEQGAAVMRAEVEKSLTEGQWEEMAPMLDELVGKLEKKDQEAVLLRFYQRKSLAEVGEEMGVSEAAAQKRVERAVEKLRGMFRRQGMAVGSSMVLAAGLEAYTTTPASAALVATTTQSALAAVRGGAVGGQLLAIAEGAMKMMKWAQVKVAAVMVVGAMSITGVVVVQATLSDRIGGTPTAAAPPATEAAAPATKQAWRTRFDAVYCLQEGQVLKFVASPFIPERMDYYCEMHGNKMASEPDAMFFRWNGGALRYWGELYGYPDLGLFISALGIERYQVEGPAPLLRMDLRKGDVILRTDATEAQRFAALQEVIRERTGRDVRFELRQVDREVVVARGRFELHRLPDKESRYDVDVYSDVVDLKDGGGGGSGDLENFFKSVGSKIGRRIFDETDGPRPQRLNWRTYQSSYLSGTPEGEARSAKMDQLLAIVSEQTDLSLMRERRTVPVWMISEQR